MAKKNTKSRYWVDDNSILPEIVVTPQGNYPVLDEAGNPARTVGAIQDINPNAHIYERVNTQPFMDNYIEGETNAAANQYADATTALRFPSLSDLGEYYSMPKVRERLFLGVKPQRYERSNYGKVFSAITGLGYNKIRKERKPVDPVLESLWAEYLQQPSYMINELYPNLPQNYILEKSPYVPTVGGDSATEYMRVNPNIPLYGRIDIYKDRNGEFGPFYVDAPFSFADKFLKKGYERAHIGGNQDFPEYNFNLGEYIGTRGNDDNGDYISYYDKWDLSPFGGTEDQSMGIGKPLNIYDRVYLDDYYGVSEPTHATYLPEVEVTPNSHSQGGPLKSASWNDLSMREKADIIKVGVKHGLNRLADIKSKYNELAEGDSLEDINLYSKGGKKNRGNQAITISPNVYKAMKFLMDRGMPRVGAAGLVGGFMRESSGNLSPNALNPSSKAIGIAQWLGPRKRELIRRYGSNPTFEQQLEFVWHELNTNYKRALRELMAAKTPTQAADAALGWYEFSVGPMGAVKAFNDTGQDGWGALHKGRRFTHAILGAPYQMPQNNSVQEVQQPMYQQQQYSQPVMIPQNPYPMPTVDYQKLAMQQMEMLQRDQEERARQATYLAEKEQREAERNRQMGMLNLVMSMGAPEESNDNFFNSMLGLAMSNNAKKEETDYSSFNPFSLTV